MVNINYVLNLIKPTRVQINLDLEKSEKLFYMFHLPIENTTIKESTTFRFRKSDMPSTNISFELTSKINPSILEVEVPLLAKDNGSTTYKIPTVFDVIKENIKDMELENDVKFFYDRHKSELLVQLSKFVTIHFDPEKSHSLMRMFKKPFDGNITEIFLFFYFIFFTTL